MISPTVEEDAEDGGTADQAAKHARSNAEAVTTPRALEIISRYF